MSNEKTEHMFIQQLRALSTTMGKMAEQENAELYMGTWVRREPTEHNCGFAACVMGSHALIGENIPAEVEDEVRGYIKLNSEYSRESYEYRTLDKKALTALELANYLDRQSVNLLDAIDAAESVYSGGMTIRFSRADFTGLFTDDELKSFNHLNKDDPTASDAKEYIDALIVKLVEREVE